MLKKGMVADEKRWTLKRLEKLEPSGPCWKKSTTLWNAQEGFEFALGIVQQDQHEGDPAGSGRARKIRLLQHGRNTEEGERERADFCICECWNSRR